MYTKRNFSYWYSELPVTTVNEEHIFSSLMPVQDFELLGQQLSSGIWLLTRKWQSMLVPELLTDIRKLEVHWNFIFLWRTGLYCPLLLIYNIDFTLLHFSASCSLNSMQTPSLLNEAQYFHYFLTLRNYSCYGRITPTDKKPQTWLKYELCIHMLQLKSIVAQQSSPKLECLLI